MNPTKINDTDQPQLSHCSFSRRSLMCAAGAAILAATGCGGGGHGGSASSSVQVAASVDLLQIGGTGLRALTLDGANPLIPSTGSYSQAVSKVQAQIHCLVDADNAVRSFSVTSGGSKDGLRHDAESTATGLVFMTLGILSTDPGQAKDRIAIIQSLSSFAALESYLATHLPNQSVKTLGADPALQGLVGTCISDYWNAQGVILDASPKLRLTSDPTVSATRSGSSSTLSNSGWRFVAIAREDLAADGSSLGADIGVPPYTVLGGAHGFSVGNFAVGSIGKPSTFTDGHVPTPDTASVRYWFSGTGGHTSGQTPPASIEAVLARQNADASTALYYLAGPFIDACGGIASGLDKSLATFSKIVDQVLSKASYSVSLTALTEALDSGDAADIHAAAYDLLTGLIGIVTGFITLALGEEAAGLAAIVSAAFTVLAAGLAVANLGLVFTHWISYQDISAITLDLYSIVGSWDENGVRAIVFNSDGTAIEAGIGSGNYTLVGNTLTLVDAYGTYVYTVTWTDADHFTAVGTRGTFVLSRESRSVKRNGANQHQGTKSMLAPNPNASD